MTPGGDDGSRDVEAARVLARRAAELARPLRDEDAGERIEVITFQLAWERYAVEASRVRQVVALRHLSRLPGAPRPLHGVTSWRGGLLTVLDLRGELGLTGKGLSDLSRLLVMGDANALFALLVDAVDDALALDPSTLAPLRRRGATAAFIRGVTPEGTVLLDGRALVERFSQT